MRSNLALVVLLVGGAAHADEGAGDAAHCRRPKRL